MANTPGEPGEEMLAHGRDVAPVPLSDISGVPEDVWEVLLDLMKDQHVIPIIGPELLSVPWQDQAAARLYDVWGEELAKLRKLHLDPDPDAAPLLYRVASRVSMLSRIKGDLEHQVESIIRSNQWPMPESLRLLAQIRDFPLYITTTIDHLMKAALDQERGGGKEVQEISFNKGGKTDKTDLPKDFTDGDGPLVFHLFGATSKDTAGFAATEDELIEFSWALIDSGYAPNRLFDFLHNKTILLLGCDFPDWLARFFIYALMRRPDADIAVTFVSSCEACGLREFLERREARVLPAVDATAFVAELHRRWSLLQAPRQAPAPGASPAFVPPPAKKGSVFISYCREDQKVAEAIRRQLDESGIDTWMDETGLEPGSAYREVIHSNIENASFFIAVISRALDLSDSDRQRRFVFGEWNWAVDVAEFSPPNASFLLPVAIDDTPSDAPFIHRKFRQAQWTVFRDGKLPDFFVKFLKDGIRSVRSQQGGGRP